MKQSCRKTFINTVHAPTGGTYQQTAHGIIWNRPPRKNELPPPPLSLTNFTAEIVSDVTQDDGDQTHHFHEIHANVAGDEVEFSIPSERYASMSWVAEKLGARAVISPGTGLKDHARTAIALLSRSITSRHVFTHTGWSHLQNKGYVYLHQGGALGGDGPIHGVETRLPHALSHFCLPDPEPSLLRESLRASLQMLQVARDEITFPSYAAMLRASLGHCPVSLHFAGGSGVLKTSFTAPVQQHFGMHMDAQHLPASWASTANALEAIAFAAKDAPIVVDDFRCMGTTYEINEMHTKADRLLRGQANHLGRERLNAECTLRTSMYPRGTILSTGEDVPRGASLRARLFIIEIGPHDINSSRLRICQQSAHQGLYAMAMSHYLCWLANHYRSISTTLQNDIVELSQSAHVPGMHRRTPESVANLAIGLRYFLRFAQEQAGMTEMESTDLWERGWRALVSGAQHQQQHWIAYDPVQQFFQLLLGAIAAGKAHLASIDGRVPLPHEASLGWRDVMRGEHISCESQGDRVGWVDDEFVYLNPRAAFNLVQRYGRDAGEQLPVTLCTLTRRLKEGKKIICDPNRSDHNTLRKTVQGARKEVLCLPLQSLLCEGDEERVKKEPRPSSNLQKEVICLDR